MVKRGRPIILHQMSRTTHEFHLNGVYAFQSKGKWLWLQRLCFYILRHLRCEYRGQEVKVETVRVEYEALNALMLGLADQYRAIDQLFDGHGGRLLMGPEIFRQICREPPSWSQLWEFDFQCSGTCNGQLRVIGLRAVVIAWMTGVLLVPNRYLLKVGKE